MSEHLATVYVSEGRNFCRPLCATETGGHVFELFIDVADKRCEACCRLICPDCNQAEPMEDWLELYRRHTLPARG